MPALAPVTSAHFPCHSFVTWIPSGRVGLAHAHHRVLYARALVLHTFHQTLSPNKFSGQQRQPKEHYHPAGSRRKNHYSADQEQREASQYFEEALHLIDRAKLH